MTPRQDPHMSLERRRALWQAEVARHAETGDPYRQRAAENVVRGYDAMIERRDARDAAAREHRDRDADA